MKRIERIRKWFVRGALALAIFIPIYMAIAALGSKFGLWDWRFSFGTLVRNYGVNLLKISALVSILALLLSLLIKPRRGWVLSLIALSIPIAGLAYGNSVRTKMMSLPFIHDISTDTQDPPGFTSVIIELRGEDSNPVNYVGKTFGKDDKLVSIEQVKAYHDVRTIESQSPPSESFDKAVATVKALGWTLQSQSDATGIIEATDTSFWFGFKDDVVIRIRESEADGSLIDVRSISRVGGSDIGANAARIRKFTNKFNN